MGTHTLFKSKKSKSLNETRSVMNSLRQIVQGLRNSSQASQKHFGLTSAQFFVLRQIKSKNELSLNELANLTFTHQSTVSETVGKLVSLGMVSKNRAETDSRRVVISVTKKGDAALAASPETAQERLAQAILKMPARKRGPLSKILGELVKDAEFSDLPPSLFFEDLQGKKAKNVRS
jgi:DNA-binding MarR family transcriptional regulator